MKKECIKFVYILKINKYKHEILFMFFYILLLSEIYS